MASKFKTYQNAPIPGENFTSDNRNYPWHRPPDIVDLNEAVDFIAENIFKPKVSKSMIVMIDLGVTIATLTNTILMKGVSKGRWSIDYAILLAGPTARMLELLAKKAGIEYRMGIEEDEEVPSADHFRTLAGISRKETSTKETISKKEEKNIIEQVKSESATGFATRPQGV